MTPSVKVDFCIKDGDCDLLVGPFALVGMGGSPQKNLALYLYLEGKDQFIYSLNK